MNIIIALLISLIASFSTCIGALFIFLNIKKENKPDEKIYTYYIKSYDGYFVVQVNCGLKFENMMWPIIEKMDESFEIL